MSTSVPESASYRGVGWRVMAASMFALSVLSFLIALDLFVGQRPGHAAPRLAEEADRLLLASLQTQDRQGLLDQAQDLTSRQARQSPADPRIALRQAQIATVRADGLDENALGWLELSLASAGYDPTVELERAALVLGHWRQAPPQMRNQILQTLRRSFRRPVQRAQVLRLERQIRDPAGRLALAAMLGAERAEAKRQPG